VADLVIQLVGGEQETISDRQDDIAWLQSCLVCWATGRDIRKHHAVVSHFWISCSGRADGTALDGADLFRGTRYRSDFSAASADLANGGDFTHRLSRC
jgi:hypothetical protein